MDPAREEAAAERAVGDEADPELSDRRQDLVLDVAGPERVLALQGGDRVDGVRAADRLGGRLREAEVANLPLLDELGHGADGLLDRRVRIDAMLVVDIDVVGAEPLERGVTGGENVLAVAADAEPLALLGADAAELCREHDLVAAVLDRAADEPLVLERPVRVGRVEEIDPKLERAVDRRDRLALVRRSVELGHPHAAEADRGGLEALRAEAALIHRRKLPVGAQEANRLPIVFK